MMTLMSPGPVLERLAPALERDPARDQALEPALVRARERLRGQLVVSAVGVDGAEHDGVVEDHVAVEAADVDLKPLPRLGDAGQADDAGRGRRPETARDHGGGAGAFHQDVGREPPEALAVAVIDAAQIAHDRLLRPPLLRSSTCTSSPRCVPIRAASSPIGPAPVTSKVCGCQTRAPADALGVVPGLGEDAGRLEQHAKDAQIGVDLDGEFRLDAEALGAVAVPLLDAALGVAPVAAHVPFALGAGEHGSGSGRRTMPTTRSPGSRPDCSGAAITVPSDSWPRTRRCSPGGGEPWMPLRISRSVPHTPSASVRTRRHRPPPGVRGPHRASPSRSRRARR